MKCPFSLKFIIVLIAKTKTSCLPFGACIDLLSLQGASPPLYPVGLSGLTLKFLYIVHFNYAFGKIEQHNGKARLAATLTVLKFKNA